MRTVWPGEPIEEVLAPSTLRWLIDAQAGIDSDPIEAPVPAPMTAYRGLPSLATGFGTDDPDLVARGPRRIGGYLVLSHGHRLDPVDERASFAAVIECNVPAGIRGLWLAGPGDPCSLTGADIILLDRPFLEVTGSRREPSGVVVVEAEVLGP